MIQKLRQGQEEFIRGVFRYGIVAFLARRQYGKTTTCARLALLKMMKTPGHTVIFGSAKISLSREITEKEGQVIRDAIYGLRQEAESNGGKLDVYDAKEGKCLGSINPDEFANVYEQQRLEFRFYHDRTTYSRTKVVALRPDTVGETGDLILDEVGRVGNWREVWEAVEPITSSNSKYRICFVTTPPPDDAHFSWEQLCPPANEVFAINPKGNWYRSAMGIRVLRVSVYDAYADGVELYDPETRKPITPQEHRRQAHDRDGWDRNYDLKFVAGGIRAVGRVALTNAQARGIGHCRLFQISDEGDFGDALAFLDQSLSAAKTGIGLDLATTENEESNPTSLTVMQQRGAEFYGVASLVWKTADPKVAKERIKRVVERVNTRLRTMGVAPLRGVSIDATNERYFASEVRSMLAGLVPVRLVVASETVKVMGHEDPITLKSFLGLEWIKVVDDNLAAVAPDAYLSEDWGLVIRKKGLFDCRSGPGGMHGDNFDSHKLAYNALTGSAGIITREDIAGISFSTPSSP